MNTTKENTLTNALYASPSRRNIAVEIPAANYPDATQGQHGATTGGIKESFVFPAKSAGKESPRNPRTINQKTNVP